MPIDKNTFTELNKLALDYHAKPTPGKIGLAITKETSTEKDLALAYTPGVAAPVIEISKNPDAAYKYTAKRNSVGVISNGTAILGLGNLGALASKPVMEGKALLFKKLANIDAFDIEIDTIDPDEFINTVVNIAPTFGGINLEDIRAPDCFYIETELQKKLGIPVFHDDQHGTAITIVAGLLNALEVQNKSIKDIKIITIGAGAAAIATMRLLIDFGVNKDNISMFDSGGHINNERKNLNPYKKMFVQNIPKLSLAESLVNADVCIGLAGPNLLTQDMVVSMATNPIIFALSNPTPEIFPELAHAVRSDLLMATGRSDYPNQINNVLCFPYIFRGALDARAKQITSEMKTAAIYALINIVKQEPLTKESIIPKPFDQRLHEVSIAVASAASKPTE